MSDVSVVASDVELLAKTAAGDTAAYAGVVAQHQAAVFRYARILVGQGAEDVLQQAFLDGMRGAHTYAGQASVRTWLLVLTRHAAVRSRRLRAGEPAVMVPLDELGGLAGWGEDPEQALLRRSDGERLRAAMGRLPAAWQEVLVLRDLEGLSGVDAAAVLGVDVGAAKSRLHRARLALAAELRGEVCDGR